VKAPPTVETRRLLLRAPESADVDAIFEIQGDAVAMRHTYAAPDREATARYLAAYAARFHEDGFAPWIAMFHSEGRVIGWGGLHKDPKAPQWGPEVSYFIHPHYWGRGLAAELVEAALRLAFEDLRLPEVSSFTRPANRASARVLRKTGFAFVRHVPELERDQYSIERSAWEGVARRGAEVRS
jgi:ribosomal-protein-alanine N-acetyltransferase